MRFDFYIFVINYALQELLQFVSDSDLESLASSSAFVSDTLQPIPSTPFGAMIAKQIYNAAASNKLNNQQTGGITIGEKGKTSVREVSLFFFSFCSISQL